MLSEIKLVTQFFCYLFDVFNCRYEVMRSHCFICLPLKDVLINRVVVELKPLKQNTEVFLNENNDEKTNRKQENWS